MSNTIEYRVVVSDIKTEWYYQGKLHREDGPAIEYKDGKKCWYLDDLLHNEDGPAIIYSSGTKHWYWHGHLHREDGPAIEYWDGSKHWYQYGQLHREDGPARWHHNSNDCQYWLNNTFFPLKENWEEAVKNLHQEKTTCDGKIVEIDGKKYQLKLVE